MREEGGSTTTSEGTMTDDRKNPPFRRRQLARTLRRERERAGLTQQRIAGELYTSTTRLSRIELAQCTVDVHLLKSMLDLYGVPADRWQRLIDMCLESRSRGWWHEYGITGEGAYVGLEAEADAVDAFVLTLVPGLLQTADYTRGLLREMMTGRRRCEVEKHVALRASKYRAGGVLTVPDGALRGLLVVARRA